MNPVSVKFIYTKGFLPEVVRAYSHVGCVDPSQPPPPQEKESVTKVKLVGSETYLDDKLVINQQLL